MITSDVLILMLHHYRQNPVLLADKLEIPRPVLLRFIAAGVAPDQHTLAKLYDWCYKRGGDKP